MEKASRLVQQAVWIELLKFVADVEVCCESERDRNIMKSEHTSHARSAFSKVVKDFPESNLQTITSMGKAQAKWECVIAGCIANTSLSSHNFSLCWLFI